jgi:hypothetical protein
MIGPGRISHLQSPERTWRWALIESFTPQSSPKWRDDGKVYLSDESPFALQHAHLSDCLPAVGSPGESSLDAAESRLDRLPYYVRDPARDDGAHNFYNNSADFERGVRRCASGSEAGPLEKRIEAPHRLPEQVTRRAYGPTPSR